MKFCALIAASAAIVSPLIVGAQSTTTCGPAPSGRIRPSVASGYRLQVVATGLSRPRGLAIDSAGHLLVVQAGRGGISAHSFNESRGCLTLTETRNVTGNWLAVRKNNTEAGTADMICSSTTVLKYLPMAERSMLHRPKMRMLGTTTH